MNTDKHPTPHFADQGAQTQNGDMLLSIIMYKQAIPAPGSESSAVTSILMKVVWLSVPPGTHQEESPAVLSQHYTPSPPELLIQPGQTLAVLL